MQIPQGKIETGLKRIINDSLEKPWNVSSCKLEEDKQARVCVMLRALAGPQ
jgi:hypothetical protein